MTRNVFEEHRLVQSPQQHWKRPSDCALRAARVSPWQGASFSLVYRMKILDYLQSALLKTGLLPLNPDWKTTEEERTTILRFFKTTLGIIESSAYLDLIYLLRLSPTFGLVASQPEDNPTTNYEIINDSLDLLSDGEKAKLR